MTNTTPNPTGLKQRILAATLALAIPAMAAAEGIGYVDARRLINQSPQGMDELKLLESEFAERSRELHGKFEAFQAQEAEIQKEGVLLSAEELQAKTRELRELKRQLQREESAYNEDYARRRNDGLGKLEKLITAAIIAVAKQQELDLVLQQVVYASANIDLTENVLTELTTRHQQPADN